MATGNWRMAISQQNNSAPRQPDASTPLSNR